jgi:predicted ATPase/DNA-binding CsgD family transcriptional regulator
MLLGPVDRRIARLPAEVTGFVGREQELTAIAALLAASRLVTITGTAGVGKSRVALRVAAQAGAAFSDGAAALELSAVRDAAGLKSALAAALGLPGHYPRLPGRPSSDAEAAWHAVLGYLRRRELLLVLDTCEHLIEPCAALADAILRTAPGVTMLVTSRQPLDVTGEALFPITPLPVPGENARESDCDAMRLFAQRAAAACPGFAVTDANRAEVARICRRLDGLPLAIELAAVRLRALPLRELAARLDRPLTVLTGGRRSAVSRHQGLRESIAWSYDTCTPAEQTLWARLSVFAGSFGIDAAAEVCASGELSRARLIDTIAALTDKSVLIREGRVSDGARYRLLGALREFGAQRLALTGSEVALRNRHTLRYELLARQFCERFCDDEQLTLFRELRADHDNVRAAVEYTLGSPAEPPAGQTAAEWAAGQPDRERDGAALTRWLYMYWLVSGQYQEGTAWLDKVLARFPAPAPERAHALVVRGILSVMRGRGTAAAADARDGIALAGLHGDERLAARGYLCLALAHALPGTRAGEAESAAVDPVAEAERRLTALRDRAGLLMLDTQLARGYQLAGRPAAAHARYERALARLGQGGRGNGERWLRGSLHAVAATALLSHPAKQAECRESARLALAVRQEFGDIAGMRYALELLGCHAALAGRHERAAWLLGAAAALRGGTDAADATLLTAARTRAAGEARAALGDAIFDDLSARGAGQPAGAIVGFATGDVDVLPAPPGGTQAPAVLTNRERQIAGLVAQGLSNREIAEREMISRRTVDAHVEHIYGKLGISSRVRLATLLRERG